MAKKKYILIHATLENMVECINEEIEHWYTPCGSMFEGSHGYCQGMILKSEILPEVENIQVQKEAETIIQGIADIPAAPPPYAYPRNMHVAGELEEGQVKVRTVPEIPF